MALDDVEEVAREVPHLIFQHVDSPVEVVVRHHGRDSGCEADGRRDERVSSPVRRLRGSLAPWPQSSGTLRGCPRRFQKGRQGCRRPVVARKVVILEVVSLDSCGLPKCSTEVSSIAWSLPAFAW